MKQPPPLPAAQPPEPPPLTYAGPLAYARPPRRVFDVRMFGWSAAFLGAWVLLVLLVVPRVVEALMDFKVRLPFAARVMINVWDAMRFGAWLLIVPVIPVALGFIAAAVGPGGRRVLRLLLTLLFAALLLFSVLSLLLPLMTLMSALPAKR